MCDCVCVCVCVCGAGDGGSGGGGRWFDQNKSRIQKSNLASFPLLGFEVMFIKLHSICYFGHVGMMAVICICIHSTVSFNVFIETIKQITKFISYFTTVTNRRKDNRSAVQRSGAV